MRPSKSDEDSGDLEIAQLGDHAMLLEDNSFVVAPILSGDSRFGVATVTFGPDGNLYSTDIAGNVYRYNIDSDTGFATSRDLIASINNAQILGAKFHPDDPNTLWVSYAVRGERFSGTISKIDLSTGEETLVIEGLPNSERLEHQVNGIDFGPDGNLYVTVGGTRSLGGEGKWVEPESPLSAAVIVADVINDPRFQDGPINVHVEADGSGYDPTAPDAPVYLYATGLRNAYDVDWVIIDGENHLISAINQSDVGPNSARTPDNPNTEADEAIYARPDHESIVLVQQDVYYGHPNPSREEYILNGGNPTAEEDPYEVLEYAEGTLPEDNFDPSLFFNLVEGIQGFSPNGIEQYVNEQILLANFSGGRGFHIFNIEDGAFSYSGQLLDESGNRISFAAPLDVAVDPSSGRIYVANFGDGQSNPFNGGVFFLNPTGEVVIDQGGDQDESAVTLIEAESLAFNSYTTMNVGVASGGAILVLDSETPNGEAIVDFRDAFGTYKIDIGYFDLLGGQSEFQATIANETFSWIADADLSDSFDSNSTAEFTIDEIEIGAGDILTITSQLDDADPGAIDYVRFTFIPDNTAPFPNSSEIDRQVRAGENLVVDLSRQFTDAENDNLSFQLANDAPEYASIENGFLIVEPPNGIAGSLIFGITADDGLLTSQVLMINLAVLEDDTNPVGPVIDSDVNPNRVLENAEEGSLIGVTAQAEDIDGTVSYSLDDPRFQISTDGVVSVAADAIIDSEQETSITIKVTATSTDGTISQVSLDIEVGDIDEFDIGPVVDVDTTDNSVAVDAEPLSTIGLTAFANDEDTRDTVSYSVDDGRFDIDENGIVRVAEGAVFDLENEPSITIMISALSSDGSQSDQSFDIIVVEESNSPVSAVTDTDLDQNAIVETALPGTRVGISVTATDPDVSDVVSFNLSDDRFTIAENGDVTIAENASFSAVSEPLVPITITAVSTDGSNAEKTFFVGVFGAPISLDPIRVEAEDMDLSNGYVVEQLSNYSGGQVVRNEGFVGSTAVASYTYAGLPGAFALSLQLIDESDGEASVSVWINDNQIDLLTLTDPSGGRGGSNGLPVLWALDTLVNLAPGDVLEVRGESNGGQSFEMARFDYIELAPQEVVYNVGPVTDIDASDNSILESASAAESVGITALAIDFDNDVGYTINDSRFNVTSDGVVLVSEDALFDAETEQVLTVEITAHSADGSSSVLNTTISVLDVDESDVGDIIDSDPNLNALFDDAQAGASVGITLSATDNDVTDTVTFTLNDSRFELDSNNHIIVAENASFDAQTEESIRLLVTATSTDGSEAEETFDVTVSEPPPNQPVGGITDVDAMPDTILDNVEEGALVGITALAVDPELDDTVSYSVDDDRFAVDALGTISVADNAIFNATTEPEITLTVTALSTDGTQSQASFTISVEAAPVNSPINPIEDIDAQPNSILESSPAGEQVGITALATDPDADDNVIYQVDDARFEISSDGVVTIAPLASFDADSEPAIPLSITAKSSDGSETSQAFSVSVRPLEVSGAPVRIEAEDMILSDGYQVENQSAYSGGQVIYNLGPVGGTASASFTFEGDDGVYLPSIRAIDESDGVADLTLLVNGTEIGRVVLDNPTGGAGGSNGLNVLWTSENTVTLRSGDVIEIQGRSDGGNSFEMARIDYLELAPIDLEPRVGPVTDLDDSQNELRENAGEGALVGITVEAVDANNDVLYSIDDKRFAIDAAGVVSVAPDAVFDANTEPEIALTVTAASEDGSTSVNVFTVAVTPYIAPAPVGPVADVDDSANSIIENVTSGTPTGVTLIAIDPNVEDSVSIELSDDRFQIDSFGVVTVSENAQFDASTEPTITLNVTALSTDSSFSEGVITILVEPVPPNRPVGPIIDLDTSPNQVFTSAQSGQSLGLQVLATDPDAADTVNYVVNDPRFVVDSLGVVKIADDAVFNASSEPVVTLEVTANSSDGTISSAGFEISLIDPPIEPVRIEAEDMSLSGGYAVEAIDGYSGNQVVRHEGQLGTFASARSIFEGVAGTYSVQLQLIDENDGESPIILLVNGVEVAQTLLDDPSGGWGGFNGLATLWTPEIELTLQPGDDIEVRGASEGGRSFEMARFDFIELIPAQAQAAALNGLANHQQQDSFMLAMSSEAVRPTANTLLPSSDSQVSAFVMNDNTQTSIHLDDGTDLWTPSNGHDEYLL